MLAGGCERIIENRGNGNIEIRRAGKFAVFGIVEGVLEVINAGADVNASGERGIAIARMRKRGEGREGRRARR